MLLCSQIVFVQTLIRFSKLFSLFQAISFFYIYIYIFIVPLSVCLSLFPIIDMISVSNLPFEIIEDIDHYLSHADRFQLMQVNQAWHQIFIVLLYRTITIETHQQFKQLVRIFEEHSTTTLPLGRYVHQLHILLDELEEEEMRKMQSLCPFVQSVHIDWRIWNYLEYKRQQQGKSGTRNFLPRTSLPPYAFEFLSCYGGSKLSTLCLDLFHIEYVDTRDILCYTPNLRNLTLMGMNGQQQGETTATISIQFIENVVHVYCPYLESLSLEGQRAEAYHEGNKIPLRIQPTQQLKRFKLQCQYGADRYQYWLPYLGAKYPNLTSLAFDHSGDSKDILEPCPDSVYTQFIQSCPKLRHIRWNNSVPDFRFFQQLDLAKHQKLNRLEVYDNLCIPSLLLSAMFESRHATLANITQLTFGPVPRGMLPHDVIVSIGKACPQLLRLHLCEPQCNLATPFKIDSILDHCQKLVSLKLERIALRVSFRNSSSSNNNSPETTIKLHHPLRSLMMRHCSSFDGVFDYMSPRCPDLDHLSLFAYTQRDRRYKVQINFPHQKFKKIELHGLRTESYDVERRIRFFSLTTTTTHQQQDVTQWLFMKQFHVRNQVVVGRECVYRCMEIAQKLQALSVPEIRFLHALLEKPIPWSDVEMRKREFLVNYPASSLVVQDWHPKDIYDAGYVDLVVQSIDHLYINKKKVSS